MVRMWATKPVEVQQKLQRNPTDVRQESLFLKEAETPAAKNWNPAWLQQYDLTYLLDTTQKYEWDLPVKVCMFGSQDGEGAVETEETSGSAAGGCEHPPPTMWTVLINRHVWTVDYTKLGWVIILQPFGGMSGSPGSAVGTPGVNYWGTVAGLCKTAAIFKVARNSCEMIFNWDESLPWQMPV